MTFLTDQQVIQAIRAILGKRESARVHLYYGYKIEDEQAYSAWWVSNDDSRCTPETIARMHTGRVTKVTRGDE